MIFSEYKFQPENKFSKKSSSEKEFVEDIKEEGLDISIVGFKDNSPEENEKIFGEYVAKIFAEKIKKAEKEGRIMVFDMATGDSPKSIWPAIEKMVKDGSLDISNVIVIGHEEAWGDYESESKSDFDAYRKKEFFERNNIKIRPIISTKDVMGDKIEGNFIPMHQTEDADSSAKIYFQILQLLRKKKNITWFGLYGVGTDGHIGEMQVHSMGLEESLKRRHVYADSIEHYSVERGAFQWKKDGEENFHPENNIFWQRGEDKEVGRAIWQGYTGIGDIISLGWKEMIEQDTLVLVFNNKEKSLAFKLALEGSFSGKIQSDQKENVLEIKRDLGEKGGVLSDLEKFANELEEKRILKKGSVQSNRDNKSLSKIHNLFKMIYKAFDDINLPHDDLKYKEMWKFTNRYLGKTAPVSRLIKLRSIKGKETIAVITPEVIQNTEYEVLLKE